MRFTRTTITLAAVVACLPTLNAETPVGFAFTYQGRLEANGAPVNGLHDLKFRLFDASAAGTQIGPEVHAVDLTLTNGLFTQSLNFGSAAFDGGGRWLEISVFDPGAGNYTVLSPRQPITPAPYALFALNHAHWRAVGSAMTNDAAGGFVGINRTARVSGAEYFGIQAPVQSGYGGMYTRTDGAAAKPFYGYWAGGQNAWSYLDGASGDWRFSNGVDQLTIAETGRVGVGVISPSATLQVHNPNNTSDDSLKVVQLGPDKAALLESHQANSTPAVSIYKNQGTALEATGDVAVGGKVYAKMGNSVMLGTPIAFGSFDSWVSDPHIRFGTDNFTVEWDVQKSCFVVTVYDDSDPASWMVTVVRTYQFPAAASEFNEVLVGAPDANGAFDLVTTCPFDCEGDFGSERYNFVVHTP